MLKAHGGGTIAVASQSSADNEIIEDDALVAGIGGFSGNESQVTITWFAHEVSSGRIRWVLSEADQASGANADGRVGAREIIATVRKACLPVNDLKLETGTALYDCSGRTSQLTADFSKYVV